MIEAMHRLVYYSRNRLPEADLGAGVVDEILAVSRRNNDAAGVTGALMFNAGCFAQVLEGPQSAVEATFERIQQDERHGDVMLLACGPVKGRAFEGWSMGYVGASASARAHFSDMAGASGFDPARLTGERLFETLHALALAEEPLAA